ncbi:MAG: hypothetical protein V4665_01485 [Patescibacteria group bacterium]
MNPETRNCQNCKNSFNIEPDDFSFYEKIKVPPPTFCYICRAQRRFTFRNERVLYKRKTDFTGKDILAMFSPESGIKVYENEIWQGDEWDPMEYGVDYDFSKPFFVQFFELLKRVPIRDRGVTFEVNSPYANHASNPKNSYLVFNTKEPEDCMYGHGINQSRFCIDISHISKCEFCYEGFWLTQCNNSLFSSQCVNSFNMMFSKNCVGCNDCFGCVNLRKKSYCIFNEEYSKEECEEKIKSFDIGSYKNLTEIKKQVAEFWLKFPNKFIEGLQNDKVSGNYIDHSKDIHKSMLVRDSRNMRYCQYVQESPGSEDCMDYSIWGDNNQLVYECHSCGVGTQNIKFCVLCQENVHDLEYSMFCTRGSENLFACIGLRNKKYCILNKEYTKEEYLTLVEKIKKHIDDMPYVDKNGNIYKYGEFFPAELSPVSYHTTLAQEYFPLTKEEARKAGYVWEDDIERNYSIDIESEDLPNHIKDVNEDILNKVIRCAHRGECNQLCTTAFKIIPDELQMYRKLGVPLPRLCSNCRTFERLKQRTGINLYQRKCMKENCSNEFETAYSPDQPDIVYCESCYQQEVV